MLKTLEKTAISQPQVYFGGYKNIGMHDLFNEKCSHWDNFIYRNLKVNYIM